MPIRIMTGIRPQGEEDWFKLPDFACRPSQPPQSKPPARAEQSPPSGTDPPSGTGPTTTAYTAAHPRLPEKEFAARGKIPRHSKISSRELTEEAAAASNRSCSHNNWSPASPRPLDRKPLSAAFVPLRAMTGSRKPRPAPVLPRETSAPTPAARHCPKARSAVREHLAYSAASPYPTPAPGSVPTNISDSSKVPTCPP